MNSRVVISVLLVSLGFILAFLPSADKPSLIVNPDKVLTTFDGKSHYTADQVAKFIVTEDSTVQLIDVRPIEEYAKFSIPGSHSLPYQVIIKNPDTLRSILGGNLKNIFYSNGDIESSYAMVIASGMGFSNVFTMQGGLNSWFKQVMNSEFKGERISARENALFEARTKAKRIFIDINSLPDSLKRKYMKSRQLEAEKLDGGCE